MFSKLKDISSQFQDVAVLFPGLLRCVEVLLDEAAKAKARNIYVEMGGHVISAVRLKKNTSNL